MSRMTVTLDDDVEALLHKAMRERGVTFKDAVNEAIRRGLGLAAQPVADVSFPSYALGEPRADLTRALALAGALEDDEIARKLEQGR